MWPTSLFARRRGRPAPAPRKPAACRLALEPLEDRTVPTVTLPAPGQFGPVVLTGTQGDDHLVVATAPVLAPGNWLAFSDDGGRTLRIVIARYVTGVTAEGLSVNDTLTLDSSAGLLGAAPSPLRIAFDGGGGFDRLELVGNPGGPDAVVNPPSGPGAGTVTMTDGYRATVVQYQQVEAVLGLVPTGGGAGQKPSPGDPASSRAALDPATAGGVTTPSSPQG